MANQLRHIRRKILICTLYDNDLSNITGNFCMVKLRKIFGTKINWDYEYFPLS